MNTLITQGHPSIATIALDIEEIYKSNGWGNAYTVEKIEKMFSSCHSFFAVRDGVVVGLIRAFGDDDSITHLSEVLVHKSHHKEGIGLLLCQALLDRFKHTAIYVEALGEGAQQFFLRAGLKHRPQLTVLARGPV